MKIHSKTIKRVLSMVMAIAMILAMVPTSVFAASMPETLYLKPNANWTKDGARFAAYFFGNGEKWVSMTDANGDGTYEVTVPSGYPKVIFCRMNPGTTANNWSNKWNQTGDLTIPTDNKNLFTVPNGAWDGSTTAWSHIHVYTAEVKAPTCTEGGYTTYTCFCGDTYNADETTAAGHSWSEGVCGTCGAVCEHTYVDGVCTVCGMAEPVEMLYLVPNSNWKKDNARFAAYFFGNGETWVSMTDEDNDGVYEVEIPEGYPSVIFCRMNPGAAANNWSNKWNQTADLTVPADDKNCYTVAPNTWDSGNGTWSVYTPTPSGGNEGEGGEGSGNEGDGDEFTPVASKYSVAGTIDPAGWSPENGTKLLTTESEGVFTYTYTNVAAGSYEFKVTDGTWNNAWPGSNYALTLTEVSDVTITFNESTKAVTVETKAAFVPVASKYSVAGTIDPAGWSPENGTKLLTTESEGVFTYTYTNVAAGSYEFKVTDGTWNNAWPGSNYALNLTEVSDVTITFNESTKAVTVETKAVSGGEGGGDEFTPVASKYSIAGTISPAGWSPENGEKLMTTETTGVFTYTYTNVAAGSYEFKVTDGTWNNAWPGSNYALTLTEVSDVTITFNESTKAVTVETKAAFVPVASKYSVAGTIDPAGWSPENGEKLMTTETEGVFAYTYTNVAAGSYEFKVTDGTWTNAWPGSNYALTLTEASDVTITFNESTKEVKVETKAASGGGEPAATDYYLIGWINGADHGHGGDYANMGDYKFVDGKVDVTITDGSYVYVKTTGNAAWYMTQTYEETATSVVLYNTDTGAAEKMFVPAGEYTFTLVENADGTLTLSYAEAEGDEGEKTTYTAIFHFANTIGWSPLNLYIWNNDGATLGSWPGTAVTKLDDNGYHTMTVSWDAVENNGLNYIFNSSSGQTVDLSLAAEKFDATTNTAEVWVELDPAANGEGKFVTKQVSDAPLADVKLAVSPRINGTAVTFEYVNDSAAAVEVRGTVTGASWEKGIAMTKNDKGIWTVTVENLAPAVYEYKFVADGNWSNDPANGKTNAEGNSVFTITDPNAVDTNEVTINVYYDRADGIYTVKDADGEGVDGIWNAYVWGDGIAGVRKDFTEQNGKWSFTLKVPGRATRSVYLKPRLSTEAKDWLQEESQVTINLENIVSGTVNVYVVSDGQDGNKGNMSYSVVTNTDIVTANKVIDVQYDYKTGKVTVTTMEALDDPAKDLKIVGDATIESVKSSGNIYTLTLNKTLSLKELYQYKVEYDGYEYDIEIDNVYATKKFADEFTYEGTDLGATYTASKTTFRVWAPTATAVSVKLYKSGTKGTDDLIKAVPMDADVNGTWVAAVDGDLNGTYYTYLVTVDGEDVEAVDPYARAAGVNGNRGMVIDLDSTDPAGWASDKNPNPVTSQTDAIIYELHVRDFSIDDSSGVSAANRGKYLAFTEEGTKTSGGVSTGIDYLDDLGITHLHLLPVYDYGSVDETKCNTFNWGYDPVNYNVPEGSYSTNPYDGATRVNEFKQMVKSLHEHDISVVMDVVYNHVYNADKFCFNNIVPGYFSRVNSNTSGCGNDTASEREMVRKYIVESVLYWHQEYHIDGFRFDLVGLLDVQTINEIVAAVHACCPDVIFYGEGWDMDGTNKESGTEMAKQGNASKTPGFAYFSDSMRNGIGGSNGSSKGFASGAGNGGAMVKEWMANPWWTSNPQQVIQYASCHDNYTLYDKLVLSTGTKNPVNIAKMNNLAAAYYMTAQGVPFIHAGEEFLREKLDENGKRAENSYNASDYVNHIEWSNLEKDNYAANSAYYKGLIAFRAAHPALRYATAAKVAENVRSVTTEGNLLVYRIDGYGAGDDDILVIFNANKASKTVTLPDGDWTINVNATEAGTESLGTASGSVSVPGISAMVMTKKDEGKDPADPMGASPEKTLYFSNNKGWDKVYAYAWTDNGETRLVGDWPGTEMTFVETNEFGEGIYSITLPASDTGVEGVIFHNNSGAQTVDIQPGIDGTGYYPSSQNNEGKWEVGTYAYRDPIIVLGDENEYFLVGYINGEDYVGADYKFVDGKVTAIFEQDAYVNVVNGTMSETYMTDGYQGAVTSATMKDINKLQLTADKWDKLLIPGGAEVTITMVKNNDSTITLSYAMDLSGVADTSGIQDGVTLHCWNWSFKEIEKNMATIAAQGYTAIQTSPVQVMKEATAGNSVGSHWWVYYQPVDFVINADSGNALGTKAELQSMIAAAHKYGVKVIVDVVANHLGNQTGNDLSSQIPEYLRKDEYWHDITTDITDWSDRYDMTQNCLSGLPDLNTANDDIQGYVLKFLKECIDIGVDGFRFDMAKSIETPKDDASFASDFWPTVVGGAESYAKTKGKDIYVYGEILDNAVIAATAYTEYMAITDNGWGNHLRSMIAGDNAGMVSGYYKSALASNLVIWAESHDTFADGSSSGVSEADIHKTWALVAARADAMGLYLARPESLDQKLGVASLTGWDNPEVKAVNKFHNHFDDQSEHIANENGISYVERGTTGAVLVKVAEPRTRATSNTVTVTAHSMADGTYIDQITGNVFTVKDGKITGEIGDTGIAVIYNAEAETYDVTVEKTTGGTVSVDKKTAKAGETVTITLKPADGKVVDKVTVTDVGGKAVAVTKKNDTTYTFVQPEADVTVKATFVDKAVTDNADTADLSHVELSFTMMALSVLMLAALLTFRKKQQR